LETAKVIFWVFVLIVIMGVPVLLVLALRNMDNHIYRLVVSLYAIVGCISIVVGSLFLIGKRDKK